MKTMQGKFKMKRNKTLFSIGVSIFAIGTVLLTAGCRPVEDSRRNGDSGGGYHYTTYYTITYDLSGCTPSDSSYFSNYKPAEQKVKVRAAKHGNRNMPYTEETKKSFWAGALIFIRLKLSISSAKQ